MAALTGSSLAAAWDLKTTEIPDEISYVMVIVALLVHGYLSLTTGNVDPIVSSVSVGLVLFAFGYALYHLGQWGGGDVKLLAAIGALIPGNEIVAPLQKSYLIFPWPVSYLFNVFFVGAIYMLVYATVMAFRHPKVFTDLHKELKKSRKVLTYGSAAMLLVLMALNWTFYQNLQAMNLFPPFMPATNTVDMFRSILIASLAPLGLTMGFFVLWKFIRSVEAKAFKRRIPVKELRVGDVLEESKLWEGITEQELNMIKRSRKNSVSIKEGVRFAPAFPLAILFTLYYGDAILLLLRVAV